MRIRQIVIGSKVRQKEKCIKKIGIRSYWVKLEIGELVINNRNGIVVTSEKDKGMDAGTRGNNIPDN